MDKDRIIELPKSIKNKSFCMVNQETGQLEAFIPVIFPKKKVLLGGEFMLVFQDFLLTLANSGLTQEQYRVLCYLMGKLDFENYIVIKQTQAAKELGINQAHISRAIKKLEELDIVRQGPRGGMIKSYQLNPYYAFKGKNQQKMIVSFEDLKKRKEQEKQ